MAYTPTSIGVLPGGSESQALGASADGSVIVGESDTGSSSGFPHAFRWTSAGGIADLGLFPGGIQSVALACSADGSVVVGLAARSSGPFGAFLWTSGGGMVDLGNLGTGTTSQAFCISADGLTVGGLAEISPGSALHPFKWTAAGGMVDLGLFGANAAGATNAASANGSILAGGSTGGGDAPWTWDGSLSAVPLPSPYTAGQVNAISSDGLAAAASISTFPNNLPYYWSQAGGAVLIPLLAGQSFGVASGISGDGLTAVGRCGPSVSDPDQLPFIWTSGAGTVQLPILAGSSFGSAYGMSSDASTIVGSFIISGIEVAAYWGSDSPPPPTPLSIVLPAALGGWRSQCGINWNGLALVGDRFSNVVGLSDFTIFNEYGNQMRMLATTPPLHEDRKRIFVTRFEIEVEAGEGTPGSPEAAPEMIFDYSKDGGVTWVGLRVFRSMGKIGEYIKRLRWINLGQSRTWVFRIQYSGTARPAIIGTYIDFFKGMG